MPRVAPGFSVTLAVLALSMALTSSTFASWFVGGAELKTLAKLSTTAKVDSLLRLLIPVVKITVDCSGSVATLEAPEITPGNQLQASSVTFQSCEVVEPLANCRLESLTIKFTGFTDSLQLAIVPAARGTVSPKTGKQFGTIPFAEGNTCALEGAQPLKGQVNFKFPTGQAEESAQAMEGQGSVENNSLEVGSGNKSFIDGGSLLFTLESGSKWSFR